MATSPPAGWYSDPGGSGGQRYWDGEHWTEHRRSDPSAPPSPLAALAGGVGRFWLRMPAVLRLALPIVVVLALVGFAIYVWVRPPESVWSQLPKRLDCQLQAGSTPPPSITIASVQVGHPRSGVLQLVVRFAEPLPPPPSGSLASGFAGYVLTFTIANNGEDFVEVGPEEDAVDLAIRKLSDDEDAELNMRADLDTNARRTTPQTVEINLDLGRLGVGHQLVVPELTLGAEFSTPSTVTVEFASQVCRGQRPG
ncbi:DUF2510 domain-containing protein [Mycobacterium spongiae]|uniref:DUF2510 domain-containing protein n=1 Tax=Mycobacterium spongiae TaxID=886343 RepID=A0A975K0D1_9MYCO|nr:DUF2510 domain-containing protein [Mycobacterium spongiae]QUR69051.1 DUF2510 domain-containing protein [Mycobacterium spongiae]